MHRTTVMLPAGLYQQAMRAARQRGQSLGALVRAAIAADLGGGGVPSRSLAERLERFAGGRRVAGRPPAGRRRTRRGGAGPRRRP